MLLVALAYFVSGRLGLAIPYVGSHITLIWLPTGIAVAVLLRWGRHCWPGVFLGAFATNFSVDGSPLLDGSIALGNTFAPLMVVWLLRRYRFNASFDRAYDITLLVLASVIGMLFSASIGVGSLVINNALSLHDASVAWQSWWAGDVVGVLLGAPLLLNISRAEWTRLWAQRLEFLAWCMVMLGVSVGVFVFNNDANGYSHPLVFLVLPVVVWSSMRLGMMGASLGVLLLAFIIALATAEGLGPFHSYGARQGLLLLWFFFVTLVLVELMVVALQAARKRAEAVLQESEVHNKLILDIAMDAVISTDHDGLVQSWNREAERIFGYTAAQTLGKDLTELIVPPVHRAAHRQGMRGYVSAGVGNLVGKRFEITALRADGVEFPIELTLTALLRHGRYSFTAFIRDISERNAAQAKLMRLTNLYAALSQCNQAIVRCTSEAELFPQICLDAVQIGGMKMAWIGMLDVDSGKIEAVASYGTGTDYLDGIQISVDAEEPSGRGPIGVAMREDRPYWCQDYLNDSLLAAWHERGARYGWRASAALPLHRKDKVIGVITLYSGEVNAFDTATRDLLEGMARDISYALTRFELLAERKHAEDELRIAAATFDIQQAILITDADSKILRVNKSFQDITGYSESEVIGHNPRIFKSGRHDAVFYQGMWAALHDTGKWSGEVWDKRKNGEIYPKSMTITAVYGEQQQVTQYVAVFRDISSRKKSEQDIHQLAYYDPLTHLPNRRLLLDRLQQAMAVSARKESHGALLFMDMDNFKVINDTRGHAIGDLLLIEVARRLKLCVREGDSVARLGGDEFVVVLEDLSGKVDEAATQTEQVAENIRNALARPYLINEFECLTTPSIGVSLFYAHQESSGELLKHADVAMYQAKAAGRNAIRFFDPAMQVILDKRDELLAALRHALQKQQLQLYYQVQVDSARRPLGAEVLLRWNHPERGLVSPLEFIPLAEESGLIIPIGLWVLETACAQLKSWQRDGLTRDLTLAVNVSAKQFRAADFVTQVQRAHYRLALIALSRRDRRGSRMARTRLAVLAEHWHITLTPSAASRFPQGYSAPDTTSVKLAGGRCQRNSVLRRQQGREPGNRRSRHSRGDDHVDKLGRCCGRHDDDGCKRELLVPERAPGTYTIAETQPTGYGDPPSGPFAPNTRTVTVANTSVTDQNFGDTLGGLSGLVYQDLNDDGIRQPSEPAIPGVTVTLFNGTTTVGTTTTAADGTYNFTALPAGTYRVVETQPAGFTDGKDTVGSVGGTLVSPDTISSISLPAGVLGTGYNFGELFQGISGTVFLDVNKDGDLQTGEVGIPGVTITLTNSAGAVVGTTTTDANGNYSFPNVPLERTQSPKRNPAHTETRRVVPLLRTSVQSHWRPGHRPSTKTSETRPEDCRPGSTRI